MDLIFKVWNFDKNGVAMHRDYRCKDWEFLSLVHMSKGVLANGKPGEKVEIWLFDADNDDDDVLLWQERTT